MTIIYLPPAVTGIIIGLIFMVGVFVGRYSKNQEVR